jgi:hypothetical protein
MSQAATTSACASSGEALLVSNNMGGELYFPGISSNFLVPPAQGKDLFVADASRIVNYILNILNI